MSWLVGWIEAESLIHRIFCVGKRTENFIG